MFEAGVSSLRPSYDVAVEDPGPTSDGAVCQSESCTPPGGAGPGECDPNIECCNHYSIGMPLDDYGLDCSSFEDVRGRDPYLFANCDQDVVTKPYLRNGKYDYFFVGQKSNTPALCRVKRVSRDVTPKMNAVTTRTLTRTLAQYLALSGALITTKEGRMTVIANGT